MRRLRVIFALGVLSAALGFVVLGPTASPARAAADGLFIDCDNIGTTGANVPCIVSVTDSADQVAGDDSDDENYRGTVVFMSSITPNFTVTPHDPGNEKAYTFKAGDLQDKSLLGKDFSIVFYNPGTGTVTMSAAGIDSDTTDPIVISGDPIVTTTTTSTTLAPTSTTSTTLATATTTTLATTTSTLRATTTTVRAGTLERTGSSSGPQAAAGGLLLALGALLVGGASIGVARHGGKHYV